MATNRGKPIFSDAIDVSQVDSTPLVFDDLRDLRRELIPASANWTNIGITLGLHANVLDSIKTANISNPDACLTSMVTEWLKKNHNVDKFGEPTWRLLVEAVGDPAGGANMELARNMAKRHKAEVPQMTESQQTSPSSQAGAKTQIGSSPPSSISYQPIPPPPFLQQTRVQGMSSFPLHLPPQPHSALQEPSKPAFFASENHQTILGKFADFQTNVCNKLFTNGVDAEQVRLYVESRFSPIDCIPPPPADLKDIFGAITRHRLWDYFHCSPLIQIAEKFGANDSEIKVWVQTYKKDLKAYSMVAKVKDYIEEDLLVADTPPIKRAKYENHSPVEWKTKFLDHSLQYLTDVWESFSYHYLVPDSPPTALLDRVRRGCLSITWLVPSGLIPQLIERARSDADFFERHCFLSVKVGEEYVYEEEVTKESTSVKVAKLVPRKKSGIYTHSSKLNIAAIDFGTINCSVAYTIAGNRNAIPVILALNQTYYRVPTAILFKPDGSVDSFGYEARAEYLDLDDEERLEYTYFEQIKMNLQHNKKVNKEMKIKAKNGNEYYLLDVLAQILNYLKIELIEKHLQHTGCHLEATDFHWVINVPAIWRASGEEMMREAGYKAGLCSQGTCDKLHEASAALATMPDAKNPNNLSLVLDPECAAVYCQTMSNQLIEAYSPTEQSTCYLIVDIGGGTVDISAHRVSSTQDRHIEVVHLPAGNYCGGSMVNKEFKMFLEKLVKDEGFSRYLHTNDPVNNAKHSADLDELVNRTFEEQKVRFGNKGGIGSKLSIRLPFTFLEVYKDDIDSGIRQMKDSRLKRIGQDLRIEYTMMADFFQFVVQGILECMSQTLTYVEAEAEVDTIYLVGGFARYIYKVITKEFGIRYKRMMDWFETRNYKYITPAEPDFAVIRGAIFFRQNPDILYSNSLDLI